MTPSTPPVAKSKQARVDELATQRRHILSMPGQQALQTILDHPLPVTLVQSMAAEDLYFLIHDIGVDDALPVIALAANEQWQYLLDMEIWTPEGYDGKAVTTWLARLLKADPDRFTHWVVNEQLETLETYLNRQIQVRIREHDQEAADFGNDWFTDDETYYIRIIPSAEDDPTDKTFGEQRELFIRDLLHRLSVFDHSFFQNLLQETGAIIPAEVEEEQLRLRHVRLAEKGFLPFDEAVGAYQGLTVEQLLSRPPKPALAGGRPVESYPVPIAADRTPEDANLLTRALARIEDDLLAHALQSELAGLCNQIISADQRPVRSRPALAEVVEKVSGYISIGIEQVQAAAAESDPHLADRLIRTFLLADIFRVGFGAALALKWRAERWHRASWFGRAGLPLGFWGETWLGVLGGLLIKKPLFFDNYASGVIYREFATLADIQQTEKVLADIIAFDDLLALMHIEIPEDGDFGFLTCQNLVLTLWAQDALGTDQPLTLARLSLAPFKRFFDTLWTDAPPPRKIRDDVKSGFLDWLAVCSGLGAHDISRRMATALEALFSLIESEMGTVAATDIDPRYVQLFLLENAGSGE